MIIPRDQVLVQGLLAPLPFSARSVAPPWLGPTEHQVQALLPPPAWE